MKLKQKYRLKKTERYIRNMLLEEYFREMSEDPNSIWASLKISEQRKKFDDLGYILDHLKTVPKCLFKYRSCNANNFKALEDNSIWVSSAEQFMDPYDCRLPFSIKNLPKSKIKRLAKWFVFASYIYVNNEDNLSKDENSLTPEEVRNIFFAHCYNDDLVLNVKRTQKYIKKKYPIEQREKIVKKIVLFDQEISQRGRAQGLLDWYKAHCEEWCSSTIDLNRKARYVCSLTETNNNPKMWEEYADNYGGFCIRYDFTQGIRFDLLDVESSVYALKGLLPVFYTERRPKFNSYKFQFLQYHDTLFEIKNTSHDPDMATKLHLQTLMKNPKYSNEQEWRIVIGGEEPGLIWFPFATGIYMGKDISKENKERLMQIAKKNNLTVYQQKIGVASFEYEIVRLAEPREIISSKTIIVHNSALN
ncbi:MAG: DUF2971 domain-containing protein [Clostridiales bacterium]|nr:DUF2971 domain-containing protein [Clostridiales bacterium]